MQVLLPEQITAIDASGKPQALGLVLGAVLVTVVVTGIASDYAAMAVVLVLLAVPFAVLTPDDPLPRALRRRIDRRALLSGLWVDPRWHPDFAWAWAPGSSSSSATPSGPSTCCTS